jgi:transposase
MFFREGVKAKKVAHKFGYTYRGFTTIVSEFRKKLQNPDIVDPFFIEKNKGRKTSNTVNEAKDMIVEMRKKYYSVEDIKVALDSKGMVLSERGVHEVLRREGFGRLPRRSSYLKSALEAPRIEAEKSQIEDFDTIQEFKSNAAGILCLLPLLKGLWYR